MRRRGDGGSRVNEEERLAANAETIRPGCVGKRVLERYERQRERDDEERGGVNGEESWTRRWR